MERHRKNIPDPDAKKPEDWDEDMESGGLWATDGPQPWIQSRLKLLTVLGRAVYLTHTNLPSANNSQQ